MRVTRVHLDAPLVAGRTLSLAPRASAHLARVLRLRVGDALAVFDGRGVEHAAVATAVRTERVDVLLGEPRTPPAESPLAVTLVQGVSRGERMDYAIQKATELGVRRIVPVLSERSVVKLDVEQAAVRREHWRGVAIAACEQSGRAHLPQVDAPQRYLDFLSTLAPLPDGGVRVLLAPDAVRGVRELPEPLASVELLIGPEGGLTDEEERLARERGYQALRLGPRVLRTETAAAAAIAALQALRGDLG